MEEQHEEYLKECEGIWGIDESEWEFYAGLLKIPSETE